MAKKPTKSKVEFRWKPHLRLPKKIAPEVFGGVLEEIKRENDGQISDDLIVEAARPEDSPIHGIFEWDDNVAAEAFRKEQAGYYRRHILIVVTGGKGDAEKLKRTERIAYVAVKDEDGKSHHRDAVEVLSDAEMRLQAIEDCLKQLVGIRRRFSQLTEMSKVFRVIDETAEAFASKAAAG